MRLTEPSYQLGWEEGKRVHHTLSPSTVRLSYLAYQLGWKVRGPSQLMEKVRGLQNLAYQLGWEEGKRVHHSLENEAYRPSPTSSSWEEGKRVHHCDGLSYLPPSRAGRKVLSPSQLMEKVRGLQNLAYQLNWEEVRESITVWRRCLPRLPASPRAGEGARLL